MKLPPIPWYVVLLAAVICGAFALVYTKANMPIWIIGVAWGCGSVLLALAFIMQLDDGAPADESAFVYGRCRDKLARRHKGTGEVQFLLWKIGDRQGDHVYTENFWCAFDPSWWPHFTRDDSVERPPLRMSAHERR